jgi:hypothetical protein
MTTTATTTASTTNSNNSTKISTTIKIGEGAITAKSSQVQ